ncbi:hypothetical protein BN12_50035 [Nostocoides japonicum T1-X7]|uniref:Uncharacterized protein n=1 Tax=Nostocoides japonicum T1-X7 TaxID=1194083 RepID=A0A077M023_9MICO|nr:hypothetical protein BN12_50035 [Tetrasphaera japonica T1-X7]
MSPPVQRPWHRPTAGPACPPSRMRVGTRAPFSFLRFRMRRQPLTTGNSGIQEQFVHSTHTGAASRLTFLT